MVLLERRMMTKTNNKKQKEKPYFISFVEYGIMNRKYMDTHVGGRIEVFGPKSQGYAQEEIGYFTDKKDRYLAFRDQWDFKWVTEDELNYIKDYILSHFEKSNW